MFKSLEFINTHEPKRGNLNGIWLAGTRIVKFIQGVTLREFGNDRGNTILLRSKHNTVWRLGFRLLYSRS